MQIMYNMKSDMGVFKKVLILASIFAERAKIKKSMYSTICSGTISKATAQGCRHKRAELGVESTIKRLSARCLGYCSKERQ